MKRQLFILLAALSPLAWGHGSLSQQAANSVQKASEFFSSQESKETQRLFSSITAVKTGHERFQVTVQLSDGTQFKYDCAEDETHEPVEWNCR